MAHQRGHKDTYRVPPAASGFEWIGGLASKLAQKTLGLDASVKQSGGYVTDPQNENMRGTAKFNTAILTNTINTRPGNNLWKIGQSKGLGVLGPNLLINKLRNCHPLNLLVLHHYK